MRLGKAFTFCATSFNTASGMDCMQFDNEIGERPIVIAEFQYRKRYGLHAMMKKEIIKVWSYEFQYRKRYGLHAIRDEVRNEKFQLFSFQYRKRYGLHAIIEYRYIEFDVFRFNTASGMDCMQFSR